MFVLNAKLYEHNVFPLRVEGGTPPIPLRKKSANKTALSTHYFAKIFGDFPLRVGGLPPISAKGFLAK